MVIREGHQFVESALRLPLRKEHKIFENDAIARFCCNDTPPPHLPHQGNHFQYQNRGISVYKK